VTPLSRIARVSAAFLGSNLVRGAIAFALSLVIGRALGVEGFGRWVLCSAWASTLTITADLGLGLLLPRDGSRAGADLGSLCGSALAIRLAFVFPAGAIVAIAAGHLTLDVDTARGLRIAVLLSASGAAYGCFGAAFRSQAAWVPTVLTIETAWYAAQLVGSSIALHELHAGVATLLWIAVAIQLGQIASALWLWRAAFGSRQSIRVASSTAVFGTARRAIPFAAAGIVANLQTRIAPLMLGALSTASELGAFGAAARLAPGAIFAGALPVLSQAHGRADEEADTTFRSFDRALAVFAVLAAAACVSFASPLLRMAYGASFSGGAATLMLIGLGLVPSLTNSAAKIALYAAGSETVATAWSAVSLVAQIALGAVLMPRYGALGAAAAIAAGEAAIVLPLRRARTAARMPGMSSPRRAPAPTIARSPTAVRDVPDPAGAR
jgi:O-antigen/teichoic acid export membrane protein